MQSIPIPKLESNWVLGKVEAATLCGTDLHIWEAAFGGNQEMLPYIPGHETCMTIAEMDSPRTDILGHPLQVGDRVLSSYPTCGHCFYCAVAMQPTLCSNRIGYGRAKPGRLLGGLAEHHLVPPGGDLIRVPDEISSPLAASAACALRTVMHGFERLGPVASHETIVVQGAGPVGLYCLAVAKDKGARQVLVIGAPADRLAIAKEFGADATLNLDDCPDEEERRNWVRERTSGRGPDVVFNCATGPALLEGLRFIRPGGRYISIGGGGGGRGNTPFTLGTYTTVISILAAVGRHFYQALEFLAARRDTFPFERILSNTYSFEQATEAFQGMAAMREVKPVILPKGT